VDKAFDAAELDELRLITFCMTHIKLLSFLGREPKFHPLPIPNSAT